MNILNDKTETNLILIGAGPIGIEMAVALKESKIEYVHLEAGCLASTINWYAPGTPFFSSPERLAIAGIPLETYPHLKILKEEYLLYLRNVVAKFDLKINYFSNVTSIQQTTEQKFQVEVAKSYTGIGGAAYNEIKSNFKTKLRKRITADKVIFAIGDMHLPNYLGIKGEDRPNVSHFLPDPHTLSFMNVTIVGGNNSAVEAAIRLYRAGANVTLIHRRHSFNAKVVKPWLLPELKSLIREKKIRLEMDSEVIEIGESSLTLRDIYQGSNDTKKISSDYTLLLTGYAQDPTLFAQLGINLTGVAKVPTIDFETNETNIKNAFIIGTAVAGTQTDGTKHFIETGHVHINNVLRKLAVFDYPDYGDFVRKENERES